MKLGKTLSLASLALLVAAGIQAQKIKVIEGDISMLKSEKSINTAFTYDNMKVGKFDKESEYIDKKKSEYNSKEPGHGDTWAKAWVDDRANRYEPKFNELFTKSSGMSISKNARYTLVYKTSFTEPGFNVGISRKNAETNAEAWIVETATQKVVAKLSVDKAKGRDVWGADFDTGARIAECYADAGKALGSYVTK